MYTNAVEHAVSSIGVAALCAVVLVTLHAGFITLNIRYKVPMWLRICLITVCILQSGFGIGVTVADIWTDDKFWTFGLFLVM